MGTCSSQKFSIKMIYDAFWQTLLWHSDYMASPAELCLFRSIVKILDIPVCSRISVSGQFAEAVEVKSVEFLGVPFVYCLGVACI